jgi:hypothetical protein
MVRGITLILLGVLGATAGDVAVIVRHDRTDDETLKAGAPFTMVGFVPRGAGCTLIAPAWAATAAHVAKSIQPGSLIHFGDVRAVVKRTVIHPHGDEPSAGVPPDVDLALIEFTAPVAGITPATLYRSTDEVNQLVHIVGYGDTGNPRSGVIRTDNRRRAVTNHVSEARPVRLMVRFDEPPNGTPLEGVGGPGDSGGPALIVKGTAVLLAGVSSGSMGPPGKYGLVDVYTRVSAQAAWIDAVMRGDAK